MAATTWRAEVSWDSGFRSTASIRDFDPIASDERQALGGTDSAPNPVEQLLAALGNWSLNSRFRKAVPLGIDLTG